MPFRNLSPQAMFEHLARSHQPRHRFTGSTLQDFTTWKEQTLPLVIATLGHMPEKVPPEPQLLVEYHDDGLTKQRWVINVGDGIAAHLLCNFPAEANHHTPLPALLCCHGHGAHAKEAVMGNTRPRPKPGDASRCDYGHMLAKAGFATFAIDAIGFGERNDNDKPNFRNTNGRRDWCNLYYLHATMLGTTPLAINITHNMAAIDFAATLPQVDASRLGVIGASLGGTMAMWMALCDHRIKATEIVCYSGLWSSFGIRDINYCGSQVAPGLFSLVDLPDLQGLLAPRPLLVDIGAVDTCFNVDESMACQQKLTHIYTCANATDHLELDLFPGEHGWPCSEKSTAFFRKHLA